jgi:hypothetical protein
MRQLLAEMGGRHAGGGARVHEPWAPRVFILIVLPGFSIAPGFAWAFGITADRIEADGGPHLSKPVLSVDLIRHPHDDPAFRVLPGQTRRMPGPVS